MRRGENRSAEIRRCRAEDSRRMTEVAHAAKRYWGYPERFIEQWRKELTLAPDFVATHPAFGAFNREDLAGFYVLLPRGNRMELEHFWIDPRMIRRGLGRRLFEHAVEFATAAGARAIDIDSDPHAEGFYVEMGARRVGRTPAPTDDPERFLPRMTYEIAGSGGGDALGPPPTRDRYSET